jgi:hypothetical protein
MLCQEYARKFRAALPTELRDMVYAQVWDRETVERAFDNVCPKVPPVVLTDNLIALYDDAEEGWQPNSPLVGDMSWQMACRHEPCACFRWWQLPFWVQHQFVGFEVAKEAAAAYYRAGLPRRLSSGFSELDDMLSTDHFHLGVRPFDHLRRLELGLSVLKYTFFVGSGPEDHKNSQRHQLDIIKTQSRALLKMRLKRGFELILKTAWCRDLPEGLSLLDEMPPVVNVLKLTGVSVRVMAWHAPSSKDYDVSDYYTLPKEQWKSRWSTAY